MHFQCQTTFLILAFYGDFDTFIIGRQHVYKHTYMVDQQPMCAVTVPYIPALPYGVLLFLPFPAELFTYRQLYFKMSLTGKILE